LLPRRYVPQDGRVGNPSEHVFIADGGRFTLFDDDTKYVSTDHDIDWNARAGGGFSSAGPSVHENFMRAFHISSNPDHRAMAPVTYRHKKGKQLGIVANYLDGHGAYMTEDQSRWPDPWWPKGSSLSWGEMNTVTQSLVEDYVDESSGWYEVRR
ncbi:MAG: hypothetical protein GY778_16965, partial [bacterium]|nr:hypothetical protein [bacterium]